MPSRNPLMLVLLVLLAPAALARAADPFDRHTSEHLREALSEGEAIDSLSMAAAGKLGRLGPNVGGPTVVVRTNDGNLAKAVLAWGFRRSDDGLVPVVLVERFVTYRADRRDVTAAAKEQVMLFPGFLLNLDIGQVVPEGQGGDLKVSAEGHVVPVGDAEVVALEKSLLPKGTENADPADHDGVLPGDFGGTWSVDVDGRWTGELVLTVDGSGRASGRYTSESSKSTYDVSGRVTAVPHRIKLDFDLDNTRQSVDAYLWTTDKSRMTGTATLAGRTFGFHAKRAEAE